MENANMGDYVSLRNNLLSHDIIYIRRENIPTVESFYKSYILLNTINNYQLKNISNFLYGNIDVLKDCQIFGNLPLKFRAYALKNIKAILNSYNNMSIDIKKLSVHSYDIQNYYIPYECNINSKFIYGQDIIRVRIEQNTLFLNYSRLPSITITGVDFTNINYI